MHQAIILYKKFIKHWKNKGFKGVLQKLQIIPTYKNIFKDYDFIMDRSIVGKSDSDYEKGKLDSIKVLNWVIPEMGEGSGGHTTIFRFISNLEKRGFHSRVYLFRSPNFKENKTLKSFLREKFPILNRKVEVFYDVKFMQFAHATIATSWETAYYVKNFKNTFSQFYFVQDFEPYFFAHGSDYVFAERTYTFGLRGITAGDWLKEKLKKEYGMRAESFSFSYQKDIYKPMQKKDSYKRIFFYARPVTARRDFELGLLALREVCQQMPDVEVLFAGWDISEYRIPFKHENLGIVSADILAECYAKSDMCLVISNTNLSLVPLEVMGTGSVAICTKGDNSTWLVSDENCILVNYDPREIADKIIYYFKNPVELQKVREKGQAFAKTTSWEREADKVAVMLEAGIKEGME